MDLVESLPTGCGALGTSGYDPGAESTLLLCSLYGSTDNEHTVPSTRLTLRTAQRRPQPTVKTRTAEQMNGKSTLGILEKRRSLSVSQGQEGRSSVLELRSL